MMIIIDLFLDFLTSILYNINIFMKYFWRFQKLICKNIKTYYLLNYKEFKFALNEKIERIC